MVESPLFIEEFHGASTLAFQFELFTGRKIHSLELISTLGGYNLRGNSFQAEGLL
jgi:hypothetical protein